LTGAGLSRDGRTSIQLYLPISHFIDSHSDRFEDLAKMTKLRRKAPEKKRIGELLVEGGYVTTGNVREALEIQKKKRERICNILIDLGHLSESDFLEFLCTFPGAASIELSACEIEPEIIDLVPGPLARRLELVPIGKLRSSLTVAMVCPLDGAGRAEIEEVTGLKARPVLCTRQAVYAALDRYYADSAESEADEGSEENLSGLEDTLKLRRIARLVEEIEDIPTLPNIIHTITETVNDPDSSAADLARVIGGDVGLSSKILKLANSAAFGFSREISDIQQAIALLGFRQTQTLALSVPVFESLIKLADFDFKRFWSHSLRCAKLSKLISLPLAGGKTDSAFVAGLLHDIGQVVIAMSMRGKQERVSALQSASDVGPIAAEEEVLGITHAELGYHLGEHWLLPPALTAVIRYHHSPEIEPERQDTTGVVFLADRFCETDPSRLEEVDGFDEITLGVLESLGMSELVFRKVLEGYAGTERAPDIHLF